MDNMHEQRQYHDLARLAADLYLNQNKNAHEVKLILTEKGMSPDDADKLIALIDERMDEAERKKHKNNILIGGLFCVGGLAATFANFGYIFYGAIIFGMIQLFRGLLKM